MSEKYKIMVIDDFNENREAITELLRANGYVVMEAASGREALEKKNDFKPHIFLSDVMMPKMSGLELLKELDVKNNSYKVIMMTGYENLEDAKKAMSFGAFSYIGKPIIGKELFEHVTNALFEVEQKQQEIEYKNTLEEEVKSRTSRLEEMLKIVQNQNQRVDTIIKSISDGFVAIDNNETIILMNDEAQRILQRKYYACIGENINQLLENEPYQSKLMKILRNKDRSSLENNHITIKNNKTGQVCHFVVKVSEFHDQTNTVTGKVLSLLDETVKFKFDMMRNSLLTIVSHELRTPLTILMNYFNILRSQKDNQKLFDEIIDDLETTGRNLNYHINNIVSIASLSDRTLTPAKAKTDIEELVKNQVEQYRHEFVKKKVTVNISNRLSDPCISIEAYTLNIAVSCLISNAIKFNKEHGRVDITLFNISNDLHHLLCIDITDQGIGIPEEKLENLFEDFVQLEDHMTRHYGGIGVGLFLTKQAIELLKGSISVSSVEGQGCTFSLVIPFIL